MINLLLFALLISATAQADEVTEMITREEFFLQMRRFEAKVNCSTDESPKCNSTGFPSYKEWAQYTTGKAICAVKPGETNSLGVTDQWKCLNKWQQIRNELWKKKHEEFFAQYPYFSKDYFEIKEKYSKAANDPHKLHYQIKDSYFLNEKCLAFNAECGTHLRISIESVTLYQEDVECSYPGKQNRTRLPVKTIYPDAASAGDCVRFFQEALTKGFQKMEASGYTLNDSDDAWIKNVVKSSTLRTESFLKFLYEDLRKILKDYPAVLQPEFASNPYLTILKRTLDKLGPEIKKIDPAYDTSYPAFSNDPGTLALIALRPIEVSDAEIKQPDAVQAFFRSHPTVVSETFEIKGDYLPPGYSYFEVKLQNAQNGNHSKIVGSGNQYKNGKMVKIPEATLLSEGGESSSTPNNQVATVVPSREDAPAEVTLHELATLHAKIEISNDLNCKENSTSRGCVYYKEYLSQTLPSQLALLCKNESCNQEYFKYQASVKESLKSTLFPELESMVKAGAFVDPFKASEALEGAMKGQEAFNKVLRPVLSKYLPASEIKLLPSGVSPEITSAKMCSTSQQEETGGNQSACLSATKEILTKIQKGTSIKRSAEVRGMPSLKALQGISSSIGSKSPERVQTNNQISQRESKANVSAENASSAARASVDSESGSKVMPSIQKAKHKLSPKELEAEAKKAAEIFN